MDTMRLQSLGDSRAELQVLEANLFDCQEWVSNMDHMGIDLALDVLLETQLLHSFLHSEPMTQVINRFRYEFRQSTF
jgi:hypothetical protein